MLVLLDEDVDALLTMPDVVAVLETALRAQDRGEATNQPRQQVRFPGMGVAMQLMAGAVQVEDLEPVMGFKLLVPSRLGARIVFLADARTGRPLCMIAAGRLGQLRTGAASGLATKFMAPPAAESVGVFGAGAQAQAQLEAICAVRPVRRALVYSPTREKREVFARRMAERLGIEVAAVDEPEQACRARVLVTATNSPTPVLRGEWVAAGTHVNAIGANSLLRRELDDELVSKAAVVAVDSREQALGEAMDLVGPLQRGLLVWERVRELREVVSGARPGRQGPEEITLFKSLGIGLEDVAAGALAYSRALKQGRGQRMALFDV